MSRVVVAVLLAVLLASGAGCAHGGPPLAPAPSRSATAAERLAAYRQLRPSAAGRNVYTTGRGRAVTFQGDEPLVLANGYSTERPDDLLPVLDPDSRAARAARRSRDARDRRSTWVLVGAGIAAAGAGAIFVGDIAMGPCGTPEECEPNRDWAYAGVAGLIVGAIVGGVAHQYFTRREEAARAEAFTAYDESLRDSLGLCVSGLHLVACEDIPPTAVRRRQPGEGAPRNQ